MTISTEPNTPSIRDMVTGALRYWEPCRIIYNLVLAAVVLGYFCHAWPASKSTVTFDGILYLFLLAVLANIAYCAAYLADIFFQISGFRGAKSKFRWLLFILGTAFASVITRFFALTFFPHGV